MRTLSVLLCVLVSVPVFAGCLGDEDVKTGPLAVVVDLDPAAVIAPKAVVEKVGNAVHATWTGPLSLTPGLRITIPAGVTLVEATRTVPVETTSTSIALYNAATDRIRCQPDRYESYFTPTQGVSRCSGIPLVDPLPAVWKTGGVLNLVDKETIQLVLSAEILEATAGAIDVAALSMPHLSELATEYLEIPASSDGARLWLEVTRPDTLDPVPTIIVSSPYNDATRAAGRRPENSTIADWVPRGYAIVAADVRGFGESGGCVEVWGPNEQQDQADIVAWVAEQKWSDGKIGFYGQSYVGTTPVAAASLGAPELDTIITVAPVINAYNDWHFGGVPNGEHVLSPTAAYQVLGTDAQMREDDIPTSVENVANGFCDPTLGARAADPRGVYDAFYEERDFSRMAGNVKASVLYTQGFYDENVKSAMIPDWFNSLNVPKKGIFGDWIHQHPPRADQELIFHAWFDEWLMDIDTGIMDTPVVEVRTNVDTVRADTQWPSAATVVAEFGLDLGDRAILNTTGAGSADYLATPLHPGLGGQSVGTGLLPPEDLFFMGETLTERLYISGVPQLRVKASITSENTYFYARLDDVDPAGDTRTVSYGMLNAGLRNGYETYEPVTPGAEIVYILPFLPTEYVVLAGHRLELVLRSADVQDWAAVQPGEPGIVTVIGDGEDGTALLLPLLPVDADVPSPRSVGPVDPAHAPPVP